MSDVTPYFTGDISKIPGTISAFCIVETFPMLTPMSVTVLSVQINHEHRDSIYAITMTSSINEGITQYIIS